MIEKAAHTAAAPWKTKNKPNITSSGLRRQYDSPDAYRDLELPSAKELTLMGYGEAARSYDATQDFFKEKGLLPSTILHRTSPELEGIIKDRFQAGANASDKALREAKYQAILSDLMMSDDLLQNEDEDTIAEKYQTLISLSPDLAQDKNIARVYLRSAVQHDGMDIFSAKEHLDAQNKVLSQNTERLKLSDPMKYMKQNNPDGMSVGAGKGPKDRKNS